MKKFWNKYFFVFLIMACFSCSQTKIIATSTKDDFNLSFSEKEDLIQKALKGDANACFRISNYYKFVENNDEEMFIWLKRSAEFGNVIAQYNLACYFQRSKNETDHQLAIAWFRKSAENGDTDANLRLAEIYEKGDIIERDLFVAKELYEKASLKGNTIALVKLSDFYLKGKGCDRDKIKAYALLSYTQTLVSIKSVSYHEIETRKRSIALTEAEKQQVEIELNIIREKNNAVEK
jgi:hypothetical protein